MSVRKAASKAIRVPRGEKFSLISVAGICLRSTPAMISGEAVNLRCAVLEAAPRLAATGDRKGSHLARAQTSGRRHKKSISRALIFCVRVTKEQPTALQTSVFCLPIVTMKSLMNEQGKLGCGGAGLECSSKLDRLRQLRRVDETQASGVSRSESFTSVIDTKTMTTTKIGSEGIHERWAALALTGS